MANASLVADGRSILRRCCLHRTSRAAKPVFASARQLEASFACGGGGGDAARAECADAQRLVLGVFATCFSAAGANHVRKKKGEVFKLRCCNISYAVRSGGVDSLENLPASSLLDTLAITWAQRYDQFSGWQRIIS
jgi:hypothetical protein